MFTHWFQANKSRKYSPYPTPPPASRYCEKKVGQTRAWKRHKTHLVLETWQSRQTEIQGEIVPRN